MINNKRLFYIAVLLLPIVVISFIFKDKTNFNLQKKEEKQITIKVLHNNQILKLDLEDYIIGVVAGEMPALFDIEALRAQAVASRTYALYRKKPNNNEYDLTSDTSNQVYLDNEELKIKWQNNYDKYRAKIESAVNSTKGEIMTYNGDVIDALYFSMSSGKTQDVQSVFKENLAYLKSTDSIYDNESIKGFEVKREIASDLFISLLELPCEDIKVDQIEYNSSGYVANIKICDKTFDGNEFRKILSLRSANFKIDINNTVVITTYGYGHGVGMSQYGANGYAKAGLKYREILKHYYKDIEIKNIKNV